MGTGVRTRSQRAHVPRCIFRTTALRRQHSPASGVQQVRVPNRGGWREAEATDANGREAVLLSGRRRRKRPVPGLRLGGGRRTQHQRPAADPLRVGPARTQRQGHAHEPERWREVAGTRRVRAHCVAHAPQRPRRRATSHPRAGRAPRRWTAAGRRWGTVPARPQRRRFFSPAAPWDAVAGAAGPLLPWVAPGRAGERHRQHRPCTPCFSARGRTLAAKGRPGSKNGRNGTRGGRSRKPTPRRAMTTSTKEKGPEARGDLWAALDFMLKGTVLLLSQFCPLCTRTRVSKTTLSTNDVLGFRTTANQNLSCSSPVLCRRGRNWDSSNMAAAHSRVSFSCGGKLAGLLVF